VNVGHVVFVVSYVHLLSFHQRLQYMSDLYGVSLVLVLEDNLGCSFVLPCKVINYFNTNSSHFASTPSTQKSQCRSTISLDQQKEMCAVCSLHDSGCEVYLLWKFPKVLVCYCH
jgi:hypothetical protein